LDIDVRFGDVRDRAFLAGLPKGDLILDCAANPSVLEEIARHAEADPNWLDLVT